MLDDVLTHVITNEVGVPVGRRQQPLHPVRRGLTGLLGQRPGVLPLHRQQQTPHIRRHPRPRLGPGEPRRDPGMDLLQPGRPDGYFGHRFGHVQIIDHTLDRRHVQPAKQADTPTKVKLSAAVVLEDYCHGVAQRRIDMGR